jgi:hypothetical protein
MKYLFVIIGMIILFSCNSKLKNDDSLDQKTISKNTLHQSQLVYDSIIHKRHELDVYTEMIPLLEEGLKDLDGAKDLQNKIKIDLSGLYLLDFHMDIYGHARPSQAKAIVYFEEVLSYDSTNQFFSKSLGVDSNHADSIHIMWKNAVSKDEKSNILHEIIQDLRPKLYSSNQHDD